MGQYIVAKPCSYVSDGQAVQHIRASEVPFEVEDEAAAPLVEDGSLTPYPPVFVPSENTGVVPPLLGDSPPAGEGGTPAPRRPRGGRRTAAED